MKIALIGATGFVGNGILNELLQRGHQVTAIARHAGKVTESENLKSVSANVLDEEELLSALKGNDAVVSAYNAGWTNPNLYNEFIAGSKAVQEAVKKSGIKRLIVVGGAGSLFIAPGQQIVDTDSFPKEWKPGALAARDYLNFLKEDNELDWTFVSPAIEMHPGTSGTRLGTYRTGLENPVFDKDMRSVISVEDLSMAIADELETPQHIRKRFTVAY